MAVDMGYIRNTLHEHDEIVHESSWMLYMPYVGRLSDQAVLGWPHSSGFKIDDEILWEACRICMNLIFDLELINFENLFNGTIQRFRSIKVTGEGCHRRNDREK
jgi:hypothetical protein